LPQEAGRIANDKLQKFLKPHGYAPCKVTHGLWKHRHSDLIFTLAVDDFGIRYTKTSDAKQLMNTLRQIYRVSKDWSGKHYVGHTLKWDYPMAR
jgi:hypothetical protein